MSNCGRNFKGKKCITYRGKSFYYTNEKEISKRLNLHPSEFKLLKKNPIRYVRNTDGDVEKLDLRKNPLPLLGRVFGIKRISNKKLVAKDITKIKNAFISKKISDNNFVNSIISIDMELMWMSEDREIYEWRSVLINVAKFYDEYRPTVEAFVNDYAFKADATIISVRYVVRSVNENKILAREEYRIRENYTYNLTEYCNIIYQQDNDGNCVRNFLNAKYPKISQKVINNLGNKHGVSIKEIINFCDTYTIECYIYDVLGELTYQNEHKNKSYSYLSFIAYNNHIYPLEHKEPRKNKNKIIKCIMVDDCSKKIKDLVSQRTIPYNLNVGMVCDTKERLTDINIISFEHDKVKYIANREYEECFKILKKFKMEDQIYDSIKKNKIASVIEKKFLKENINSFLPNQSTFNKGGFIYKSDVIIESDGVIKKKIKNANGEEEEMIIPDNKISTIDKNKAYSYCLYTLPYLIVVDWHTAVITKNPSKIIDNYLYIVKPEISTILIPNSNMYAGYYLKECLKYGVKFELLEEITTTIVINRYKKMIDEMRKHIDLSDTKDMINVLIGKMERSSNVTNNYICKGIMNNDECKTLEGHEIIIDDEHKIKFQVETKVTDVYNRKPIAMQVKDMCRLLVFKRMNELKIKDCDVLQVKTDSITFIGNKPIDLDPNNFEGWKEEEFKPYDKEINIHDDFIPTFFMENNKTPLFTRKLHNCYAGCGKTTYILNVLIPELVKKNIKFRVLTPSHSALKEYKERGIICDVIQKYTFENSVPTEDYIIIDEVGFVDKVGQDMIYKMSLMNKNYESFGDFNQLPPVGESKTFNSEHYNNYIYNDTNSRLTNNYRNNFTKEYYDQLINKELNLIEEVNKYSTENPEDAEVILCYHNWVKEKYNKYMLKKLNKKWGDEGTKYICRTNKLLQEYEIYNNKPVTIEKKIVNDCGTCYLLSDTNIITDIQLERNFDLAYALNAYQIQGNSVDSYYWAPEDDDEFTKINGGRVAYTIISRLIQAIELDDDLIQMNEIMMKRYVNINDILKKVDEFAKEEIKEDEPIIDEPIIDEPVIDEPIKIKGEGHISIAKIQKQRRNNKIKTQISDEEEEFDQYNEKYNTRDEVVSKNNKIIVV